MKARFLLAIIGGVLGMLSHAQQINPPPPMRTGIQTREASETLDINGTTRVRTLPSSAGLVYNGESSPNTSFQPSYQVVVNQDGVLGVMSIAPKLFIVPRLYLPLERGAPPFYTPRFDRDLIYVYEENGAFFMNLTQFGIGQFATAMSGYSHYEPAPGVAKNPSASNSNTIGFGNDRNTYAFHPGSMYFYVTYYDTDVYTDVRITKKSNEQFLTYKVKPGAKATSKTYMNIVMVPAS